MRTSLKNPTDFSLHAELHRLVSALPVAAYTVDLEGTISACNDKAVAIWGRCPRPGEKWCGSFRALTVDGEPLTLDCAPMAQTLRCARPMLGQKVIVERPDGSREVIEPFPHPLFDSVGELSGAVNLLLPADKNSVHGAETAAVGQSAERLSRFLVPLAELTRSLIGARQIEEAAARALEILCTTLNAAVGTFWLLDGKLRLRPVACLEHPQIRGQYANLLRCTRQYLLTWGADLPGHAAARWETTWIADVSTDNQYRRGRIAAEAGLRSLLAHPVVPNECGPVRGVLELGFPERPDHDWALELVSSVSSLLGGFIGQVDLQRVERENRRRLRLDPPSFVSALFQGSGANPTPASVFRRY